MKRPPAAAEPAYYRGLRSRLRRRPRLYRTLFLLFAPVLVTGPNGARRLAPLAEAGGRVLDLGAGNDRRHPRFVNIDLFPYERVNLIADAARLPFEAGSVAGIISIAMLEHAPDSDAVLAEMRRVLAPGGRLFIVVPFLQPFHGAPHDYRRWNLVGLRDDLERHGLCVRDSGVYCGPASALAWHTAHLLARVLSLGSPRARALLSLPLQALLSPIKWLDLLLARLPGAHRYASALYADAELRPCAIPLAP